MWGYCNHFKEVLAHFEPGSKVHFSEVKRRNWHLLHTLSHQDVFVYVKSGVGNLRLFFPSNEAPLPRFSETLLLERCKPGVHVLKLDS